MNKLIDFEVDMEKGKYKYVFYKDGTSEILRNGEKWRDTTGDEFMLTMATEINRAKDLLNDVVDRSYDFEHFSVSTIRDIEKFLSNKNN